MIKIGLLSDTHGFLDPKIFDHFQSCDEIWHAGDIGSIDVAEELALFKPLRAVYGNIDGQDVRLTHPEDQVFHCEELKVLITHIGGYPGNYFPEAENKIIQHQPGLFICGHSHILKVMRDKKFNLLHMNPGAAGKSGFHKFKTLLRFDINKSKIENLEVIELGLRGSLEQM
ncbi:MAG: metallophosphoesterase family protein [Bacteroidetes bacterium]|nr:metallophosphoesterase family protein [Bacteroidota bacterium]